LGLIGLQQTLEGSSPQFLAEIEWLGAQNVVFMARLDPPKNGENYAAEVQPYADASFAQALAAATLEVIARHPEGREVVSSYEFLRSRLEHAPATQGLNLDEVARLGHEYVTQQLVSAPPGDSAVVARLAQAATGQTVDRSIRLITQCVRLSTDIDALPIISNSLAEAPLGERRVAVAEVVLSALPEPDDSTPWEDVLQFRADQDARATLRRLRHWIFNLAQKTLSEAEMREELEYLLAEHERHMHLHRIKVRHGVFEAVITSTAELIENVAKLRLGKLSKALFSARDRKVALLQAEASSPGRDVAYITRARSSFGGSDG